MKKTITAVAMLALAGCVTTSPGAVPPGEANLKGLRQASDGEARVVMVGPAYKDAKTLRIQFADPWEFEEYALFPAADGSQAEVIYVSAIHGTNEHVALEYSKLIADTVTGWNISRGQSIDWQPAQWIATRWGGGWMQPYKLRQANRACVGFSAGWDDMQDDPRTRPSKVIFGYHCAAPGKGLAFQDAVAAVQAIGIQGVTESSPVQSAYQLAQAGAQTSAPLPRNQAVTLAVLAQGGSPGQPSGHPGFPFLMSEIYRVGGGGDDKND